MHIGPHLRCFDTLPAARRTFLTELAMAWANINTVDKTSRLRSVNTTNKCVLYESLLDHMYTKQKTNFRPKWMPTPTRPPNVYSLPDSGIGEGIPLQPLLNPSSPYWNRSCPLLDRTSDQDLVPEPQNEAQERAKSSQGDQWAGKKKTRRPS